MYTFKVRKKVNWRGNKEHRQSYHRKYYKKNRKRLLKDSKKRYQEKGKAIREYLKGFVRRSDSLSIKKRMVRAARSRSKKIGVPFNLSFGDFEIPKRCPVFGFILKKSKARHSAQSPALDREIPKLGYVKGNVRVISHRANTLKRDASLEELEALVRGLRRITRPKTKVTSRRTFISSLRRRSIRVEKSVAR